MSDNTPMEGEELKVISLDKKKKPNKKIEKLNPRLPKPPFRWSVIGASFSGKTTMLCNLFRKEFYGKFWHRDHIFVFSPTVDLDDKLKECIPSNNFYDSFRPDVLSEIYSEQHAIKKQFGMNRLSHILCIFDDCLGGDAFKPNSILTKFIHKTRHYKVSAIYSVQMFKGLSTNMRANSDVISIFRCTNFGEIDKILEETSDRRGRKKMREILINIFAEPHQFLHIDYQAKDLNDRFRRGFNEKIKNPIFDED